MPLASVDFVSPPDVVATTTSFFDGEIGLDPASSVNANSLVGATKFFTYENNGLRQDWKSKNVYLFPPRDVLFGDEQPADTYIFRRRKRFQKSAQRVWLEECKRKYLKQEFDEAIVFLTSTEVALLVTQKLDIDFPLCILKEKPELFVDSPELKKLENTRCLGFIYYFPSAINTEKRIYEFSNLYSNLGRVFV